MRCNPGSVCNSRLLLVLPLVALLTGCVASNRIHVDSPAVASTKYRAACEFAWPDGVGEFRLPAVGL